MAETTDTILKTYFETGDVPTQAQFVDLIDSKASRAEAANYSQVYHIEDYGAAGDGTTDDAASIRLAIAAAWAAQGGVIAGSPGKRYKISSDIEIPHLVGIEGNGMTWLLDGAGTTLSFPKSSTDHPSADATYYSESSSRYAFARNFFIDGQDTATMPMYVGLVNYRTFEDIDIYGNAGDGLVLDATQNCVFSRIHARKGTNAVQISNGANNNTFINVHGNNASNANLLMDSDATLPQYGAIETEAAFNTFIDCLFESNNGTSPTYAGKLVKARRNVFIGCGFNHNDTANLYLDVRAHLNTFIRPNFNAYADAGLTAMVVNRGYGNVFQQPLFIQFAGSYALFDYYNLTTVDASFANTEFEYLYPQKLANNLTKVLTYTAGDTVPDIGDTITGGTSGATATLAGFVENSTTWAAGTATGDLIIVDQTGTFQSENITIGSSSTATIAGDSTEGQAVAFFNWRPNLAGGPSSYQLNYDDDIVAPFWDSTEKRLLYWDGAAYRGADTSGSVEVLSTTAPAADLTTRVSKLNATSNNVAATLANGTYEGQLKSFARTDTTGNTVTVAAGSNRFVYDNSGTPTTATTATFTAQFGKLAVEWVADKWSVVSSIGVTWA